jgi:hypothetical protein
MLRVLVLLGSLLPTAFGAAAAPVPWTAAGAHVGRLVTIEGVVAQAATTEAGRCILAFDPADDDALRVVLLIPLLTDLPSDPSRLYASKRVRATGRVRRFQGRLEMVVTPPQLEVVGLTATAAPPPSVPSAAPPPPPPPPATAEPAARVAPPPPPDPRCRAWEDDRTAARRELGGLVQALAACLDAARTGCAALGDRLGPPLSRLQALEERLARHCP